MRGPRDVGSRMQRLMLKSVALFAIAVSALTVAGCSQPLGNDMSFAKANEGYKDTLSSAEKKRVVSEMKKEQAQVQKAAGIEPETTSSTKPGKKKKQVEAKQQTEATQN